MRTRLAVLLAVPTVALIVIAGVGVLVQTSEVGRVDETVQDVRLVLGTQDVIHELQRERGLSAGFVAGDARFRSPLDQERVRVAQALGSWGRQLGQTEAGRAVAAAAGRLGDLGSLRQRVDTRTIDAPETIASFTSVIADLGNAADRQQAGSEDAELQRGLTALRTLGDAKEATGLERATGNAVFVANSFQGRSYLTFAAVDARRAAGFDAFRAVASPAEDQSLQAALSSPAGTTAAGLWQRALDGPTNPALGVSAPLWYDQMTTFIDELRTTQQLVGAGIQDRAEAIQASVRTLLVFYLALALFAVVVIAALVVAANRAVVRPVKQLAEHAEDLARRWLPQAVDRVQASETGEVPSPPRPESPVAGRRGAREIVELDAALDNVQRTVLRLAAEQSLLRHNTATSLGALGRRNQNLVRRQLGLIDDLERDVSDPELLAGLFTLDHLATRMRRNAESVLVLVGERTTRRWSSSVLVDEVLRAAISEVEDYARVEIEDLQRGAVTGAAAADVTHIAAELLENALAFSPPDRPVELHGMKVDDGYLIAIVDHGTGMTDSALATANARLRATESFLVAPTRFLGHYVVGTLARRLGVDVTLQRSPLTGLTARITVPDALLADADGPDEPAPEAIPVPQATPAPPATPRPVPERDRARGTGTHGDADPPRSTTRNGLVKRVRGAAAPDVGDRVPSPTRVPAAAERSPEGVRSMLSSFRQGFGEGAAPASAPDATETSAADEAEPTVDGSLDHGSELVGDER